MSQNPALPLTRKHIPMVGIAELVITFAFLLNPVGTAAALTTLFSVLIRFTS